MEFELCKVSGNVDLRGVWVRGNLILSHLTCSGCLELGAIDQYYLDHYDACTQSKMPSVEEFCRYEFSKWILVQEKKDKQTVMHLANFGNTHIQDNLIVSGANIQGEVFLRGAYVGQQILLNSGFYKAIHILPFLSVCAINPDDSKKVKREYLKINSEDKESDFLTYLRIIKVNTETFVENHNGLLTHPTICTGVQIVNTTINGSVNLYGVLVESSDNHFSGETSQQDDNKEGNTKVPCTEIGECSILIEDTTIGGSLVFHDENFVRKRYLKYKRNEWKPYMYQYLFACIDKVNELKPVDWSRLKKLQKEAYTNVSVTKIGGPLNIINSTINGKLDFSGLKVQGRTRISDVKVTAEIKANAVVLKENKVGYRTEILHIDMLQCDGNMLLNKLITNELKAVNTTISGRLEIGDVAVLESNFELRNSTIKGQLDVKKLDVKQDFIFEDLDVFGNITITEKLEVGRCVNINLTRIRGNLDLSKLKTIKSTTLRHTDIHGDLDLSQVDIGGNVAVKYSHIKGNAHMHRKNKTNKIIGETINFTSSNIGVLRMKVRDIPENGTWVFRDATIKHLDIHDFKEEYPSKVESEIDFRGMQFNRLTFDSKEINNGNLDMIKKFLDLGNKTSEDFTLEAYSQVEKYLRNQGRKQEADKIYATLQRRLREKGMIQNKIRICFHYLFFDKFTGFGSNWVTPMFWGIGLLVLSLSVCVSPDNFNGLDNIHWTFGVQKTLEICFPMMGFDGKMDVEFGVNDLTYLFAFNEPCLYLPIPIKVVVLLIQLGAWIIWPVFILTLSGLLKRN